MRPELNAEFAEHAEAAEMIKNSGLEIFVCFFGKLFSRKGMAREKE